MSDTTAEQDRIEQDLEETRARMDHRLEDLERHLSPGQIIDDLTSYLRGGGGGDFGRGLVENIKNNPLPVALTAVGVTWMIASKSGTGVQSLNHALDSAKQTATETMHDLRDRMQGADAGSKGGMAETLTANPLLLGALGLAAGACLAAMLPPSQAEAAAAAGAVDRAVQAVRDLAKEAIDRGGAVAHRMVDAGLASAEERGLTGQKPVSEAVDDAASGKLVEDVKDVARDAVEAGRDALKDGGASQDQSRSSGAGIAPAA
jgi:hypothetical protein